MHRMLVVSIMLLLPGYAACQDGVLRVRDLKGREVPARSPSTYEIFEKICVIIHKKKELVQIGDDEKIELIDSLHLRPAIEQLWDNAANRIPFHASASQREKLRLAAVIDVHRTIAELRESFAKGTVPERFEVARRNGKVDIFDSGSLFNKVMRQQGLCQ